jgi:hypothetical protein
MADSLRAREQNTISGHPGLAGVPAVAPASAGRRLEARGVEPLFPAAMSSNVHGCFTRAISGVNMLRCTSVDVHGCYYFCY